MCGQPVGRLWLAVRPLVPRAASCYPQIAGQAPGSGGKQERLRTDTAEWLYDPRQAPGCQSGAARAEAGEA